MLSRALDLFLGFVCFGYAIYFFVHQFGQEGYEARIDLALTLALSAGANYYFSRED